jgi:hypothetical protein
MSLVPFLSCTLVLVYLCCYNKIPETGLFIKAETYFSQSGGWEVPDKMVAILLSGEVLVFASKMVP